MIKCIIVEDEELARDVIQRHLAQLSQFQLLGSFRSASDAMETLKSGEVDCMFLDIRLPGMSGLKLLESLEEPPLVVLTTAYAEYALESYDFSVVDYLLKPISFERFAKAAQKVVDGLTSVREVELPGTYPEHIFIKSSGKFFKVNFSEIIYVEGMKDYLKVHTAYSVLITHQTLTDLEKALPPWKFLRIHRSYIVAVAFIRAIYGNSVEIGKAILPIGTVYKDAVMNFIGRKLS